MLKTCSNKLKNVHSDIRGANYLKALSLEAEGKKVLKLNTGNPAAFGFSMPESIRKELSKNLDLAVGYSGVSGMSNAKSAILKYHISKGIKNIDDEDIFICNGVSEAASLVAGALFDSGDEVLVPRPCYSLWPNQLCLAGAKPVFYDCDEANGWQPDTDSIKKAVTDRTKAILVINPNNPTGAVYSATILNQIIETARENDLIILADEIYDRLVLDDVKHIPVASLAEDVPVITMNGLSKSHCLCGFRCGWMVVSGATKIKHEISRSLTVLASVRLCPNAVMQLIIPAALADTTYTNNMIKKGGALYRRREAVCRELDRTDGISYTKNPATFYMFPKIDTERFHITDDRKFAYELLEKKHILIVPGSGFLWDKPDHFRIVMLPDEDTLKTAVSSIGDFLHDMEK